MKTKKTRTQNRSPKQKQTIKAARTAAKAGLSAVVVTALLAGCLAAPVFAADYTFGSGPNSGETFGKSTGYDEPAIGDPLATNERRNKDAAYNAPLYGVFSGDVPTSPSSLYHDNSPSGAGNGYSGGYVEIYVNDSASTGLPPVGASNGNYGGTTASNGTTTNNGATTDSAGLPPIGTTGTTADTGGGSSALGITFPNAPNSLPSTSAADYSTAPKFYEDGSMGTLYIERFDKTMKVFEGETLENMKKGIGHFDTTSAWDGNAGFAGHNRGAAAYFGFVKDLQIGDKIIYATPYGTRTYEVFRKEKIAETDYSGLGWSVDNQISLITCVEDVPALRWLVQAKQIN